MCHARLVSIFNDWEVISVLQIIFLELEDWNSAKRKPDRATNERPAVAPTLSSFANFSKLTSKWLARQMNHVIFSKRSIKLALVHLGLIQFGSTPTSSFTPLIRFLNIPAGRWTVHTDRGRVYRKYGVAIECYQTRCRQRQVRQRNSQRVTWNGRFKVPQTEKNSHRSLEFHNLSHKLYNNFEWQKPRQRFTTFWNDVALETQWKRINKRINKSATCNQ